jgi:hypothetical protein
MNLSILVNFRSALSSDGVAAKLRLREASAWSILPNERTSHSGEQTSMRGRSASAGQRSLCRYRRDRLAKSTASTAESRSVAIRLLKTKPSAPAAIADRLTLGSSCTLITVNGNSAKRARRRPTKPSPCPGVNERSTTAMMCCMRSALSTSDTSSAAMTTTSKAVAKRPRTPSVRPISPNSFLHKSFSAVSSATLVIVRLKN